MNAREDIVTAIVAAADGELTGRVRLQKTVYLLDQLGLGSNFDYVYYNYGPYSRELDNATVDAQTFDKVVEVFANRTSDGARFSIFRLKGGVEPDPAIFSGLGEERVRALVRCFKETNVTVLELAATAHWVAEKERVADWRGEVAKRKSAKVQNGRLEKAVELLKKLGLPPGVSS